MNRKRREPLADKAYDLIKKKIITLEFKPGMKLEEKDLKEEIRIGRTPIREAIKMLISEGLIVNYGKKAIYVKDLSLKSAKNLMSLLYHLGDVIFSMANPNEDYVSSIDQLESLYKRMSEAIQRSEYSDYVVHNSNFHKQLAKIANNEYLDDLLERLYNEEKRLSFILSLEKLHEISLKEYYEKVQNQHKEIINLLKVKDFEGLKRAYHDHMKVGQTKLFNYFTH
jgi:GntR family transcriptional regulator, rspAB operon transcriptional repressor